MQLLKKLKLSVKLMSDSLTFKCFSSKNGIIPTLDPSRHTDRRKSEAITTLLLFSLSPHLVQQAVTFEANTGVFIMSNRLYRCIFGIQEDKIIHVQLTNRLFEFGGHIHSLKFVAKSRVVNNYQSESTEEIRINVNRQVNKPPCARYFQTHPTPRRINSDTLHSLTRCTAGVQKRSYNIEITLN